MRSRCVAVVVLSMSNCSSGFIFLVFWDSLFIFSGSIWYPLCNNHINFEYYKQIRLFLMCTLCTTHPSLFLKFPLTPVVVSSELTVASPPPLSLTLISLESRRKVSFSHGRKLAWCVQRALEEGGGADRAVVAYVDSGMGWSAGRIRREEGGGDDGGDISCHVFYGGRYGCRASGVEG